MLMHKSKSLLACLMLAIAFPTIADDTAILDKTTSTQPPKIMFLLDNSGSMSTPVSGDTSSRNRLQVLQDTFTSVLDAMDQNIEIGITTYGGDSWRERGVSVPVTPLKTNASTVLTRNMLQNDTQIIPPINSNSMLHRGMFDLSSDNLPDPTSSSITIKDFLKEYTNSWSPNGNTPIPGGIYEVTRYFKGEPPLWGRQPPNVSKAAHPSTYTGSIYETKVSKQYTDNCATQALCTRKDTTDPLACELKTYNRSFRTTQVASCIADNTCSSYCTLVTPAAPAFSSTRVNCTSNTNASCGINCGSNIGTASEPLYRCDSTLSTPSDYYSCSQFYRCKRPATDGWTRTTSAKYITPITDQCDNNFLVLLSDGQPYDTLSTINDRQSKIKSYLSIADCTAIPGEDDNTNTLFHGRCAPELIQHLASTDLNTDLDGDQNVRTYTIGFGISDPSPAKTYLEHLATKGGGQYYSADNAATLTQVFQDLLNDIVQESALSLTSSAVSVDASSQLSHKNEIFIPLTKKIDNQPQWAGNLKKYSISNGVIVDRNGINAIKANGTLKKGALDLWATQPNDDATLSGGAASLLNPSARKLYTDVGGATTTTGHKGGLGTTLNELKTNNSAITLALLNASDADYRNELLDYIRGYKIPASGDKACTDPTKAVVTDTGNCDSRQHMGDILHSKPIVISYDDNDSTKSYVFFGTNEGYLHAISTDNGSEKFAFMPQSLLDNIDTLYRNDSSDDHVYGVDGSITVWRHDDNKDGVIDTANTAANKDFVYLYFGLRRGGQAYYALNVTDPANPKLLWKIDNTTTNFSELGQTWSKPLLANIKVSSTADKTLAMVIGAGYDPIVDNEDRDARTSPLGDLTETHTKGRGVYIIDAETGDLIQSITGATGMEFGIPSDIRVLDMNKDGLMDRLYYVDTGGNIWRTDLFTDSSDPWLLNPTTRKFASLGEDTAGSSIDTRKFFHEPEVSVFNHSGKPTLVVTVGSGYHSRPLNDDITDRFYVLVDKNVFDTPTTPPATITQSNLVDRSTLTISITANTTGKLGWYYSLPANSGEKVLSSPFIFLNKVLFTTFKPSTGGLSSNACSTSNAHETRLYAFSLLNGAAALDFDNDGTKDIYKELAANHILGTPKLFFRTPDCTSESNCTQIVDIQTTLSAPSLNNATHIGVASDGRATESVDIGSFLPSVYWLNSHQQ